MKIQSELSSMWSRRQVQTEQTQANDVSSTSALGNLQLRISIETETSVSYAFIERKMATQQSTSRLLRQYAKPSSFPRTQNYQRCRSLQRQLTTSAVLRSQNASGANPARKPELELDVGELEGIKFKVEPLRRQGEETSTMRARLLCTLPPLTYLSRPY